MSTTSTSSDPNGFSYFEFNNSDCSKVGFEHGVTFPSAENTTADGDLIPSVIINNASIVVNITKAVNADYANVTFGHCGPMSLNGDVSTPQHGQTFIVGPPQVGELYVVTGQCLHVKTDWGSPKEQPCVSGNVELEAALIGDFCHRSPSADLCEGHDKSVTTPPHGTRPESSTDGSVDGSSLDNPEVSPAPSIAGSVVRPSPRHLLLSVAVALLMVCIGTQ